VNQQQTQTAAGIVSGSFFFAEIRPQRFRVSFSPENLSNAFLHLIST